jgi:hypothetical protein
VTLTVVVAPAASVPDLGETTTFLVRPGGSRTAQLTGPPDAVSVIEPAAGGSTSIVAGLTFSVPAAGAVVPVADGAGGDTVGRACVALGDGWLPPAAALRLAAALGLAVAPGRRVAVAPEIGTVPAVLPAAGRAAWCGGVATMVTANVSAAAVTAAAPACTGQWRHSCALGG